MEFTSFDLFWSTLLRLNLSAWLVSRFGEKHLGGILNLQRFHDMSVRLMMICVYGLESLLMMKR